MELELVTLATPLVILALVNLFKSFGVKGKWSMLLAVVLGVLLAVSDGLFAANLLYSYISNGLVLGLSAAGLYDMSAIIGNHNASTGEPVELDQ